MPELVAFFLPFLIGVCVGGIIVALMDNRDKAVDISVIARRWRMRNAANEADATALKEARADLERAILDGAAVYPTAPTTAKPEPESQNWRTSLGTNGERWYFQNAEDFQVWMAKNGTASGLPKLKVADEDRFNDDNRYFSQ